MVMLELDLGTLLEVRGAELLAVEAWWPGPERERCDVVSGSAGEPIPLSPTVPRPPLCSRDPLVRSGMEELRR